MSLVGKKVLLGVTGGIAVYKSADLVRRLIERGAEVRVVMTAGAQAFVTPLTFQAVSGHAVRTELFDCDAEAAMGHIELARWADVVLVAPATADFMARLQAGLANDLLTTLCLATDSPLVLAPAMNRQMWANSATQANCEALRHRGARLLGPASGEQACGEVGEGRMVEPDALAQQLDENLSAWLSESGSESVSCGSKAGVLDGVKVLITAGPTIEPIDPVRYISNHSSGKMGYAVAAAAQQMGAQVTLISGPVSIDAPANVECVSVRTAQDMLDASLPRAALSDIFIATAAVADYRPAKQADQKIKKQQTALTIPLERTDDVLASVSMQNPHLFTVGFAAETDNLIAYAQAKLHAKKLNMVAANWVNQAGTGFNADDNALTVVTEQGVTELPKTNKQALAEQLMQQVAAAYQRSASKQA